MSCEHQRLRHPDTDPGRGTDKDNVSSIGTVINERGSGG